MTLSPNQWTAVAGAATVLGVIGGVIAWAWRYITAFFALFGHARRIAELAGRVENIEKTAATKEQVEAIGATMRQLHDGHAETDRIAFEKVSSDTAAVRDRMAKQTDLERIETKVDQLLLDGFNRGANRP